MVEHLTELGHELPVGVPEAGTHGPGSGSPLGCPAGEQVSHIRDSSSVRGEPAWLVNEDQLALHQEGGTSLKVTLEWLWAGKAGLPGYWGETRRANREGIHVNV